MQKKAARDKAFGDFQYINANRTIGVYKNQDGRSEKTNRMKLMQSKNGYHAVPAPKEDKSK